MKIGILKEPAFETRVSLLPAQIAVLKKKGFTVRVEKDAGLNAYASNEDYVDAGAEICDRNTLVADADVLLFIHPLTAANIAAVRPGTVCIGSYAPLFHFEMVAQWLPLNITAFSLDMLPRTTRAQSMDILSSQANIAGYKAVLLAANIFPRYFPMFMTAAGSISPAKVLIIGAGVAGLQAIATARRLGAVVEVFDTRPAVKEEVKSLGAKFIEVEGAADASQAGGYAVEQSEDYMQKQKEKIAEAVAKADIIITTAQIPGKKAPLLITHETLSTVKPGSVIIDLAASTGGNTAVTKADATVIHNNITIIGNSNLAATMPLDASKMYGKNVLNFFELLIDKENRLQLNFDDDLVAGSCIVHNGAITNERIKQLIK